MGQSTNGELWYGVVFEDGYEFPWRAEQGFDDAKGYPAEGWLEYQNAFDAEHPCPVEVVNYRSGDYPMYGLAVRGTVKTAYRGTPEKVEGIGISEGEEQLLKGFLQQYDLKPESETGWWLSSYWG
jgi:hypothetical protein